MSDWNNGGAPPYDPRYAMYTNGQYYQAVPGTEFGSSLQPSVRSSEVGCKLDYTIANPYVIRNLADSR
jgi:hypothetical protein